MLFREMIAKVQSDLNIAQHRARGYIAMFGELYQGRKDAITDIEASYTADGAVKLVYTINGKKKSVVLGNESPYAREISSRRNKRYQPIKSQT